MMSGCGAVENLNEKSAHRGDEESGHAKAGPYSFVWGDGEDYFDGVASGSDLDVTDTPTSQFNKVGRGLRDDDDDQT